MVTVIRLGGSTRKSRRKARKAKRKTTTRKERKAARKAKRKKKRSTRKSERVKGGPIRRLYSHTVTAAGNLVTRGLEAATGQKYGRTTAKEFSESTAGKVLSTAAAVTTGALVVGAAAPAAATSAAAPAARATSAAIGRGAARVLIPRTTKGFLGRTFLTAGALYSPTLAKGIVSIPKKAAEAGKATGKMIEEGGGFDWKTLAASILGGAGLVGGAALITKGVQKAKELKAEKADQVDLAPTAQTALAPVLPETPPSQTQTLEESPLEPSGEQISTQPSQFIVQFQNQFN